MTRSRVARHPARALVAWLPPRRYSQDSEPSVGEEKRGGEMPPRLLPRTDASGPGAVAPLPAVEQRYVLAWANTSSQLSYVTEREAAAQPTAPVSSPGASSSTALRACAWWWPPARCSAWNARHLPLGRSQAADRHLISTSPGTPLLGCHCSFARTRVRVPGIEKRRHVAGFRREESLLQT